MNCFHKNVTAVLAALALLVSQISCAKLAAAPSQCSASTTTTITWNSQACPEMYLGVQCFTPARAPSATDVLLFPTGTAAVFPSTNVSLYLGIIASVIIVDSGAEVEMQGMALTALNCLIVRGNLALQSKSWASGGGPTNGKFPADSTPPIEQCSDHNGGFTPRICGPGVVYISGTVSLGNIYASLWAPTLVQPSGTLLIKAGGFLWGAVTNYGLTNFTGLNYFSGGVVNYATLTMGQTQFVGLFNVSNHPELAKKNLTIENHATFTFRSSTNFNWIVTNLVNYATVLVTGSDAMGAFLANTNFYNFGNITFVGGVSWWGHFGYDLTGTITNYGVVCSNGANVNINAYYDVNGTTQTTNGGSIYWGNGAGVDKSDIRTCNEHPDKAKISAKPVPNTRERNNRTQVIPCHGNNELCPTNFCCGADGFCEPNNCYEEFMCCPNNEPCEGYHGIYCGGYMFFQEERPCRSQLHTATLPDGVAEELSRRALPVPLRTRRYSLQGSRLLGDGTGSFVSTESIAIVGHVVLSNSKWYAMTEFGLSPLVGDGRLLLQSSTLYLGLDSVLGGGGSMIAPLGSSIVVPSQSKLVVRDYSIDVASGSFHVDGEALFLPQAKIEMCATRVGGEGRLSLANTTAQSRRLKC